MWNRYIEALGAKPESLREDTETASLEMAEAEHNLYADPNTSKHMEKVVPDGTQAPYLTQQHVLKHEEILDVDLNIQPQEKLKLLAHIEKDITNLRLLQAQQSKPNLQPLTPQALQGVGGIGGVSPSESVVPPPEQKIPSL